MPTKTIYTIEILDFDRQENVWYKSKRGMLYEAELGCKTYSTALEDGHIAFKVSSVGWVNPNHCRVVSEVKLKTYSRKNNTPY